MFYTDAATLKKYTTENRLWQGIPGIEVTKNGRIFVTFYSGKISEEIGNYAVLIKSDNGTDFSEPIAVAFEEDHRCYDSCLWIDPLNRLWFTWSYANDKSYGSDKAVYGVICDSPDADVLKWSKVFEVGKEVMMNKPTVLKNGEWLFPITVWKRNIFPHTRDSGETDRRAFAYLSNDYGKTISKLGGVAANQRSFDEHMIIELNDGRLAMYIRTTYGIAVSYSYDGGRNWTESIDSGLGGPCSRFHIRRLKSGRILLINHYEYTGRNNLTAFLSEDDGKTWKYKLMLDDRNNVTYPDAKEADDGYIYIVYDRERGGFINTFSFDELYACAREIIVSKITEDDIIAGRLVSPGSSLKIIASKLGKYIDEASNPYKEIKRYSDIELTELLISKHIDDIISILFDTYSINCSNMHKIDIKKLDALIHKIKIGEGNKKQNILSMIKLIRGIEGKEQDDNPIISRVKQFIEDNIDENISISEIADNMNMSKYYLCHLFKKETNITLMAYKNFIKIERAKYLLKNTDMKIVDVAMKCGFDNPSYFSEMFKKLEKIDPSLYRAMMHNSEHFEKDVILKSMLKNVNMLDIDINVLKKNSDVKTYTITYPDNEFLFLHESAVIKYHGRLIAAWYNNKKYELQGYTPIRFAISDNDGVSWSEPKMVADDKDEKILYCPPVFGIDDDKLYMLLNQMVSLDHMHSLDLYIYDEKNNSFEFVWSKKIPFKLNTNIYKMDNGKLILPGRIGDQDELPLIPAVLISDTGKIDADWRLVKLQDGNKLPDDSELVFPELSLIIDQNNLYGFCRNDRRRVPLLYKSVDWGENWSGPFALDIPFSNAKIYSGTLSDGRSYVIGNLDVEREILFILFSSKDEMKFDNGYILQHGFSEELGYGVKWTYPCAYEADGKLYVVYTAVVDDDNRRGAVISVIDL